MSKFVVIMLVVGSLGGGAWYFDLFGGEETATGADRRSFTVRRETLKVTLTERGTLKTKNSTQIRSETHAKIEWIIDEGKEVEKDEVLVKLDKTDSQRQADELANRLTQLEAELKSAITEETIQVDQNKTDIEKAELTLEVKRVEEKRLLEAEHPAQKRKLKLAIREAETNEKRAIDQVEASKQLLEEDFVTENQHEETVLKLEKARNQLETAKMEEKKFLVYQEPLDKRQKSAGVVEAERALERAKKRAEAQLASKKARVQQKKVQLNRVKDQLKKKNEELSKMTLKASTAGTVLYGDPDNPWNRENIRVGQQIWSNMILITLPDPTEMAVNIQVHEADIDRVKKDMEAFVTSETQKGRVYEGKVARIDTVANAGRRRWGGDDVKRFKVEVSLKGKNLKLKTGTSAKVELQLGEAADVLIVPAQAIHIAEGKHYCYRLEAGGPKRAEVELGRTSDVYVEITSGLDEGDRVLLYDPRGAATDDGETNGAEAAPR